MRFDLIVATNILVYYDAFDQALALANIAKMLAPGGFFITNYAVSPVAPARAVRQHRDVRVLRQAGNGDTLFCYRQAVKPTSCKICFCSPVFNDYRNVGNIAFSSSAVAGLPY